MSLSQNAGFTTGSTPWMRTMDSYKEINVAVQENDSTSVLAFYRQLLNLRKEHKHVLVHGRFELVSPDNEQTMIYIKKSDNSKAVAVVALNFSSTEQDFLMPVKQKMDLLVSSHSEVASEGKLAPYEGRLYYAKG